MAKTPPASTDGSSKLTHPLYGQFAPAWTVLRDLYEGTGGFLDETRPYLIPHPREWNDHSTKNAEGKWVPNDTPRQPSAKLRMRRKLARYENLASAILDAVTGALFLQPPMRAFGKIPNPQIQDFWGNADGKGADMTSVMRDGWTSAGVFGHTPFLVEKPAGEAVTAADQRLPYVCLYTPLDVLDWLDDGQGRLRAVKFAEVEPRTAFGDTRTADRMRVRTVDATTWTLYNHQGQSLETAAHGFEELPVEYLYAKRRLLTPFIGKSIIGDPQLFIDAYNLVSEVRELLRNQTFAILNVPIGDKGSVEDEQGKIGGQSGTANVLFSSNKADFISPSGDNVTAYHEHLEQLQRTIYRLASAPFEGDSRDAESADSRRLKRSEYEQVLKTYALELQRCERRLTWLAYRALYGAQAQARWDAEEPIITYPMSFQPMDIQMVMDQAGAALGLDLGETAQKEVKKRTVRAVLPDVTKDLAAQIDQEINAQEYQSEADAREAQMALASAKFGGAV